MIHGYHLIMPAYGFWLPNDPRGSWSDMVRKWELVRFGQASKTIARRTLAELTAEERRQRDCAKAALKYPPVVLSGRQAQCIGRAFATRATKSNYTIWACAILPEHTHLVVARHTFEVEKIAVQLKGTATRDLRRLGLHPLAQFARNRRPPRMWAEHQWKVYLDSEAAIECAIQYVESNPAKEGMPAQQWSCVRPFRGIERGAWITYH